MTEKNKNIMNDRDLRIAAISNYVYYIEHLADAALKDEYKRSLRKYSTINVILYEPEPDEHNPDGLFD